MAKVTNIRIEAKNRPHYKEKAFNSIILGIWGIYLGLSKKFFHHLVIPLPNINPLIRCLLKLTELEKVKTV